MAQIRIESCQRQFQFLNKGQLYLALVIKIEPISPKYRAVTLFTLQTRLYKSGKPSETPISTFN